MADLINEDGGIRVRYSIQEASRHGAVADQRDRRRPTNADVRRVRVGSHGEYQQGALRGHTGQVQTVGQHGVAGDGRTVADSVATKDESTLREIAAVRIVLRIVHRVDRGAAIVIGEIIARIVAAVVALHNRIASTPDAGTARAFGYDHRSGRGVIFAYAQHEIVRIDRGRRRRRHDLTYFSSLFERQVERGLAIHHAGLHDDDGIDRQGSGIHPEICKPEVTLLVGARRIQRNGLELNAGSDRTRRGVSRLPALKDVGAVTAKTSGASPQPSGTTVVGLIGVPGRENVANSRKSGAGVIAFGTAWQLIKTRAARGHRLVDQQERLDKRHTTGSVNHPAGERGSDHGDAKSALLHALTRWGSVACSLALDIKISCQFGEPALPDGRIRPGGRGTVHTLRISWYCERCKQRHYG